ncbi:adenylate/guanylate cyclase domain-containing protein [bacterium]|nr:adenylate/guanylate cyclase domain-containing protein [bacterium]
MLNRKKEIAYGASEERLSRLIEMRIQDGANKKEIDERIWDLFGEKWCVVFTDLSGFSKKTAKFGIIHFIQTIYESERLLTPVIEDYDGILLKQDGDSMMIIFRNLEKGIESCVKMMEVLVDYNKTKPDEEDILLCVGIGYGDILRIGDSDAFGKELNFAAKLGEDIAKSQEILVTLAVKENLVYCDDFDFEPMEDTPSGLESSYRLIYK